MYAGLADCVPFPSPMGTDGWLARLDFAASASVAEAPELREVFPARWSLRILPGTLVWLAGLARLFRWLR
jgi:hypothetical protein